MIRTPIFPWRCSPLKVQTAALQFLRGRPLLLRSTPRSFTNAPILCEQKNPSKRPKDETRQRGLGMKRRSPQQMKTIRQGHRLDRAKIDKKARPLERQLERLEERMASNPNDEQLEFDYRRTFAKCVVLRYKQDRMDIHLRFEEVKPDRARMIEECMKLYVTNNKYIHSAWQATAIVLFAPWSRVHVLDRLYAIGGFIKPCLSYIPYWLITVGLWKSRYPEELEDFKKRNPY